MRPTFKIVVAVRRDDEVEVLLPEADEVVEGLELQTLNPSFHECVQIRVEIGIETGPT
jgi:hypothetical protein